MHEVTAFLEAGPHSVQIDKCETADNVTVLDGSITNNDTRRHAYTVSVSYRSGEKVLDTDDISVPSVAPGQTATFHATGFPDASSARSTPSGARTPSPSRPSGNSAHIAEVDATQASYMRA